MEYDEPLTVGWAGFKPALAPGPERQDSGPVGREFSALGPPAGRCTPYPYAVSGSVFYKAGGPHAPNSPNTAASAASKSAYGLWSPASG